MHFLKKKKKRMFACIQISYVHFMHSYICILKKNYNKKILKWIPINFMHKKVKKIIKNKTKQNILLDVA